MKFLRNTRKGRRSLVSLAVALCILIIPVQEVPAATPYTIASAGTISLATGRSPGKQLVYDGTYWWAFYQKSTGANTLYYAYSSDLQSWTETSTALGETVQNDGNEISLAYDMGINVVVVSYYATNRRYVRYMRGNISGTSITWSSNSYYVVATAQYGGSSGNPQRVLIDSSSKVIVLHDDGGGNGYPHRSTNNISTSFSDSQNDWSGIGTYQSGEGGDKLVGYQQSNFITDVGSQNYLLIMNDDGTNGTYQPYRGVRWNKWNGTAWVHLQGIYFDSTLTKQMTQNFSTVALSSNCIYHLGQNSDSTLGLYKFTDGSPGSWTSLTAPSWPTDGVKVGSPNSGSVALATFNGTELWAFVIRGDANNTISYNKYTVGTDSWDGWADLVTSSATRDFIQTPVSPATDTIPVIWTEVNGSNYDIKVATLSTPTAVTLTRFTATEYNGKVLLLWKTGYEASNLGFHVYREEDGILHRITPEMLAGSALLTGPSTRTAGHSYEWFDIVPEGNSSVRYWLVDVDLQGKHTWHGPVTPVFSRRPLPEKGQAMLLSELAKAPPDQGRAFFRRQALQSRLAKKVLRGGARFSHPGDGVGARSPLEVQWALAGGPAVKLYIQEEGWYRVTQSELVAAGLDTSVNPKYMQLFVDGEEQPIVVTGGKGGGFGPQDAIEFYGTGLDTPFTETRVYWLVVGTKPGKRINRTLPPFKKGGLGGFSFPFTVEKKPRAYYFAALKNGGGEKFFGPLVSATPVEQVLNVQHLDPAPPGEATLEVALQGLTAGAHQVKIFLNEMEVGMVSFQGKERGLARVPLSQSKLRGGENRLRLVAQAGEMDMSLTDFIRLTYWHTYTADEDALRFPGQGGKHLSIDGFQSSGIRLMDITEPKEIQEIDGVVKRWNGGFTVEFLVPGRGERTLLAFTDGRVQAPAALEANTPSRWHQAGQGADLVVIFHGDFLDSLKPLKALREKQGLSVTLIDVEDLYDEFSFGVKTPQALRDFIGRVQSSWQRPPRFVLLAGDASLDPRNFMGLGSFDFVPTKLLESDYMETASDDWFVDGNGDGLPEMAVGRLPVRTVAEAQTVVSKIVGYEQSEGGMKEVLLVADINDGEFDFEAASRNLVALLPADLKAGIIFRGRFEDDGDVRDQILGSINAGKLLVNYTGHGSLAVWRGGVFTSDDAEGLSNGVRLPFFVSMTCLNGFFQDPYMDSLAEVLLKAESGGALAVWASSGMTGPGAQEVMNNALFQLLFNGESLTLGEATRRAKAAVGDRDVRRTWILFGDPTTRLKY